jgi:hypothetical protein
MMNTLIPLAHTFAPLCKSIPIDIKPGIYFDMPRETYDCIPALSATVIKKFLICATRPKKFAHWLLHRWAEPTTEAMLMGLALDTLLLNGRHFDDHFAVIPDAAPPKPGLRLRQAKNPSVTTVAAIAYWDKFLKQAEGKQLLSAEQYQVCINMRHALKEEPLAAGVFEHCRKAVLVAELFGQPVKCEVDLWNPQTSHIIDVKKAVDVSPKGFFYAINRYGYFEQATWYLLVAQALGVNKESFTFLAVEDEEPWCVAPHVFAPREESKHDEIFQATEWRLKSAVQEIVRRLESRNFQNDQDWKLIHVPDWYVRQIGMDIIEDWEEVS